MIAALSVQVAFPNGFVFHAAFLLSANTKDEIRTLAEYQGVIFKEQSEQLVSMAARNVTFSIRYEDDSQDAELVTPEGVKEWRSTTG